jgi:hypothetical protein
VDINGIGTQAATAATSVAGRVYVDRGVVMPATASVLPVQGAPKTPVVVPVTPSTGAFLTSLPANTFVAGSAHVDVSVTSPSAKTASSNTFTVT